MHVIEARDLVIKDFDGKSDPYAVINIGAQQFQTKKIYSTLNPKWDYYCEVSIINRSVIIFELSFIMRP